MKLVIAILRPEQLPDVKQALFHAGFRNMTATTSMGTAPKSEQMSFRGIKREVDLFSRVRLELALNDDKVQSAVETISESAKSIGGFGRIFITEIVDAVTIWTGERGPETL